jgi:hypothetical protein
MSNQNQTENRIMPVFAFYRRRDIELETGLILAGKLVVDIPKTAKLKGRQRRLVSHIIRLLTDAARAKQMPDDAITYGWPNGCRPPDADATVDNDELMTRWAKTHLVIELRVDPRNDDKMRLGLTDLLQLGIVKSH